MSLHAGISRDHSISMNTRANAAMNDYNSTLDTLKQSCLADKLNINLTVNECGIKNWDGKTKFSQTAIPINETSSIKKYETTGGSTPLWDSVNDLIDSLLHTSKDDKAPTYFVEVITDGQDNDSRKTNALKLSDRILNLQATDRWTIIFRVPPRMKTSLVSMGIPADNIQEWELSSDGLEKGSMQTQSALRSYTSMIASGAATSTTKFYANLDQVSTDQVKAALRDVSQEVMLLPVSGSEGSQIRDFVEKRIGRKMKKGAAFYQLTKSESAIQDYKKIVIRDTKSYAIYEGRAARDLLGVPHTGNIRLAPGNHGNYDIFIQSTSVNRKLDKNTQLIYWENFDNSTPAPVVNTLPPVIYNTLPIKPKAVKKAPIVPQILIKPAVKKRIRDRNPIQEQVRKWLNDRTGNKVSQKKFTNTKKLDHDLGISKSDLAALNTEFNMKFGKSVSLSNFLKANSVGDVVAFVE